MMNPSPLRRRVSIALALVLPLAILPPLSAWSADRLAKSAAQKWRTLSSGLELAFAAARVETDPVVEVAVAEEAPSPALTVARANSDRTGPPHARHPRHIFVGPAMIRRAIPPSARPRSVWTDRDGDRPSGMLIQSPGALSGTIVPGDVLFEAEGRPITSFEQLVSIVGQAYQRKAKYLSGRLYRRAETWGVTVEPGW
jgi:hypothetical protein